MPQTQIQEKITIAEKSFPQKPSLVDTIFRKAIGQRESIIFCYKILYLVTIGFAIFGGYSSYHRDDNFLFFYNLAIWAGKIGLTFYVLTLIPGMARRFGVKHKFISLLMIFRRYNGIAMFLAVFAHFMVVRGSRYLRLGSINLQMPIFELLGLTALVFAFFLFLTSNDFSVQRLKKLWNYLHKLTYVIVFLIAFHVALQKVSFWSIFMSIVLILEVISFVAGFVRKNSTHSQLPS